MKPYLEINDGVNGVQWAVVVENAIHKVQNVTRGDAGRSQDEMLVVAVGPEVHDLVMKIGIRRVLRVDAELLGDGV